MAFNKDRREFLSTVAKLGLSVGALLIFEQASSAVDSTNIPDALLTTLEPKFTPTQISLG